MEFIFINLDIICDVIYDFVMEGNLIGNLIKNLRKRNNISQRKLAQLSKVSFPQIQRIENLSSNPTIETLSKILTVFDMKIEFTYNVPNWNYLSYFGFTISVSPIKCGREIFFSELKKAHFFLSENYYNKKFERHIDAFKAFILTLYTHYSDLLVDLEKNMNLDLKSFWDIRNYTGKHIKLRNINLSIFSERLKNG